ncbi:CCA tRNA nucleotidyltransferase [Candidatus Daviesbacteria bacterium]|nr:CCA tRNA nucleotidyltransferase [Candidatus Daviesbacteria bacterium]
MNLPKQVQEILEKVYKSNFQIYIVGGAVRDLILDREVKDWDFTADAKPEEILKIFPDGFYNNKFGTVGIPIRDLSEVGGAEESSQNVSQTLIKDIESKDSFKIPKRQDPKLSPQIFEITTMRKEGDYKDHRHPVKVSWTDKIEEDLGRRDFTINALALDKNLKIIDPFDGQADLKAKLIKAVGDPNKRFQEDALRLIRAVRIASELDFTIEEKTALAIQKNALLIKQIAWERIRDELFKILGSANPYLGLIKLREVKLLQEILPELEKCFGIVQEGPKHDRIYDIGDHSLRSLKECPGIDPLVRLAALLHDVGKPATVKIAKDGNVTFYNHDVVGGKIVLEIAKRFNLSKSQTDKLYKLVRWHLFSVSENQTDAAIRRFIKNVGLENIDDLLAVRVADRLGGDTRKPVSWRMEKFQDRIQQVLKKPFSITDLKVNGNDVMKILNIKPSKKVGEILKKLFQEVLADSNKNEKEYLLQRIKEL